MKPKTTNDSQKESLHSVFLNSNVRSLAHNMHLDKTFIHIYLMTAHFALLGPTLQKDTLFLQNILLTDFKQMLIIDNCVCCVTG